MSDNNEIGYGGWSAPEVVSFNASRVGISIPKVLLGFRDGDFSDWQSVCHAFRIDPESRDTKRCRLRDVLSLLRAAGLLEFEEPNDYYEQISGKIITTRQLSYVQSALNISIKGLASVIPRKTILVTPQFEIVEPTSKCDIFVLMPFRPELDELYEDVIKKIETRLGMKVARADELFGPKSIVNDIWSSILMSKVVIADCTQRNPNVFYEIGLAHAIGKPVVLIAQEDIDVPFDLSHLRYIKYTLTPRGAKTLTTDLVNNIQAVVSNDDAG